MTPAAATAARDRRLVPGARAFDAFCGPATVVAGTRAGLKRFGHSPRKFLIAPIDLDPGSLEWPVKGAELCLLSMGADKDFILRLTQAMLADGAKLVVQINDGVASFHVHPITAREKFLNG